MRRSQPTERRSARVSTISSVVSPRPSIRPLLVRDVGTGALACSRTSGSRAYWLFRRTCCWSRATVSRLWLKTSGAADEHGVDRVGAAVEVGREDLDRRAGACANGQDALAEVLGAAVGKVVAGDGGDHDVPQAEPVRRPRPGARARRAATASGWPRLTAQKPQGRVQTSPRIMNVAVRRVQHSERFGQRALSQIVSRPSSSTRFSVKYVPPAAGIGRLSHSGSRRAMARAVAGRVSR